MDLTSIISNFKGLEINTSKYEYYNPRKYLYILGIDIGVKNLGFSLISITKDYKFNEIVWIKKLDITTYEGCSGNGCRFNHTRNIYDYLNHMFYINEELFRISDKIIIERQPPGGYLSVEQIIFGRFRNKAILISPNSMHKFMGWNELKLDYEMRKNYSECIAMSYLKKSNRTYLQDEFKALERRHDIADAICISLYYISKTRTEYNKNKLDAEINENINRAKRNGEFHSHLYLEKFRAPKRLRVRSIE